MATKGKKKNSSAAEGVEMETPEIGALSAAPSKKEARAKTPSSKTVAKPRSKKKESEGLLFSDEKSSTGKFTESEIAIRAYFISEKRRNSGLHSDSHADWLEAERQLIEELGK